MSASAKHEAWPELSYAAWKETRDTLHLWTQVVGKVRLALAPWLNHSWHVPLYVTARGLTTSPIYSGPRALEIAFDFGEHVLDIATADGFRKQIALVPQTVAEFYDAVMAALSEAGISVAIDDFPSEIAGAVPFSRDREHDAYDADYAERFWRVLLQADRLFKQFRTGFVGKASPVHFFWGSFDLAVTRFSGRPAPPHPGGVPHLPDSVVREAYSHEVSSAGFWPGNGGFGEAAFYSYAYPQPPGFADVAVAAPGYYHRDLGEFILPYDAVRRADAPSRMLRDFLRQTYAAAADLGHWERTALERWGS